jgi:anion-transporting  ArsA/GET3 family ATPase
MTAANDQPSVMIDELLPGSPLELSAASLNLDAVIDDPKTRIIVCCGAGGVGKTTTAAALALRAADHGRRVCVLTIDPARRLAQAMGLTELDNTPRPVKGVTGSGSLDAMMLDMKRTFDEVVESHSDPERAQQILENPFYQALSSSFAGTQEYMAMEKLSQLRAQADEDGRWDLIIVDTPPSRSALDFLDAPERLGSFLDGRFIRVLTAPARGASRGIGRLLGAGFGLFTGVLNKILGAQLLTDLGAFVAAVDTMFGGFRERAVATYELLQDPGTSFVVVAAPERDALREASFFVERLDDDNMPLAGLVLNRVAHSRAKDLTAEQAIVGAEHLGQDDDAQVTAALLRMHADRQRAVAMQERLAQRFSGAHPTVPIAQVLALPEDVHDLDGLRQVGYLLAADSKD